MKNAFILFFLTILSFQQLNAQKSVTKLWYIADAKIACTYNNTITSCLKIRSHSDSSWKDFPYEIEGFIFEPGVETRIELIETEILYPEDNGPKYTYKLVKVLETKITVLKDKRLLGGNKWKIINIESNRTILPSKRANAYLVFEIDSNRISGFGGCNQFGGNTLIEDGDLTFGLINSTMLSCLNDEVERQVKEALVGKAAYYVRNNMLFIVCENHTILHLRPEKKLDSILAVINSPAKASDGNIYTFLKNGECFVKLDFLPEANKKPLMFKKAVMSVEEKKTMKHKLVNVFPESNIVSLHILKKIDKKTGLNHAVVIFRDGTQKTVLIHHVI